MASDDNQQMKRKQGMYRKAQQQHQHPVSPSSLFVRWFRLSYWPSAWFPLTDPQSHTLEYLFSLSFVQWSTRCQWTLPDDCYLFLSQP